ncbi:MAG: CDP-2,3-bis-(O-geranylgeranyl)-sn-glycerol synthase [Desulfurococcales archaeon]|nr:CDP-2,3-bis-(O-geranylgeranyl)-sn-glycerol synthase [Desulfurococcales archaeon]
MDVSGLIREYIDLLVIFLPAMVANGAPVVFKGRTPLDMGREFIDGKRIFGDGKTIEGFLVGVLAGLVFGLLEALVAFNCKFLYVGFLGGLGAMLGDITGSFFKRRIGYERGEPLLFVDQLDFALCATIFYYLIRVEMNFYALLLIYLTIFILHVGTNRIAYDLKLKDVPY